MKQSRELFLQSNVLQKSRSALSIGKRSFCTAVLDGKDTSDDDFKLADADADAEEDDDPIPFES